MLSGIIAEKMQLKKKTNFIARRKGVLKFDSLSDEEKMALIKEKPEYGNIVCRCEICLLYTSNLLFMRGL